jgi:hypothetical protein
MRQLGVELILAHSPQAKGRVERRNGLLQDRLVKELRLAGISDVDGANADVHRSLPQTIDAILSWEQERVVQRDWTVGPPRPVVSDRPGARRTKPGRTQSDGAPAAQRQDRTAVSGQGAADESAAGQAGADEGAAAACGLPAAQQAPHRSSVEDIWRGDRETILARDAGGWSRVAPLGEGLRSACATLRPPSIPRREVQRQFECNKERGHFLLSLKRGHFKRVLTR